MCLWIAVKYKNKKKVKIKSTNLQFREYPVNYGKKN